MEGCCGFFFVVVVWSHLNKVACFYNLWLFLKQVPPDTLSPPQHTHTHTHTRARARAHVWLMEEFWLVDSWLNEIYIGINKIFCSILQLCQLEAFFFFILIFISLCITCISFSKNIFSFTNKKQLSEICSLTQLSVCSCPTKVIWFE